MLATRGDDSMLTRSLTDPAWSEFVASRGDATPFHQPFWALTLADCYKLDGYALVLGDAEDTVVAGLPVLVAPRVPFAGERWISLPFTDGLSPLVDPDRAEELGARLEALRSERGLARIEVRGRMPGAHVYPVEWVTHDRALGPDPDENARDFDASVARNIRAAKRQGVVIRRMESEPDLVRTYFDLHVATRRRLGVPTQPRRLFELLWKRGFEQGHGFGLLACHNDVAVAGAVFLTGNGTVLYKFGASDSEFWHLRPNNLLFDAALRIAAAEGNTRSDFGRSEVSADGLRRFKAGWGATEHILTYSAFGTVPASRGSGRGQRAAEALIRSSPAWVTRAAGAVYRYAS